jgi:hypothetical protein
MGCTPNEGATDIPTSITVASEVYLCQDNDRKLCCAALGCTQNSESVESAWFRRKKDRVDATDR